MRGENGGVIIVSKQTLVADKKFWNVRILHGIKESSARWFTVLPKVFKVNI